MEFHQLQKPIVRSAEAFEAATILAQRLLVLLRHPTVQEQIVEAHQLGASSQMVQSTIFPAVSSLGFASEKKGLFDGYKVAALRPDYYLPILDTGIILEVERGKTTTNNMDLLDLWKCHICTHAEYLFLLVPQARPSQNGTVMRHFRDVSRRLATFFIPGNYVNVDAVYIFGY